MYPDSMKKAVVEYAGSTSNAEAARQFGIKEEKIAAFRRSFALSPKRPLSKIVKDNLLDQPDGTSKSTPSKVRSTKDIDRIMMKWVEERMKVDHYPSLTDIARKSQELIKKCPRGFLKTFQTKAHISLALKRTGLHPRWSRGAKLRKSKKTLTNSSTSTLVLEEMTPLDQDLTTIPQTVIEIEQSHLYTGETSRSTTLNVQSIKDIDRIMMKWVEERMKVDHYPSLTDIARKSEKLIKKCPHGILKTFQSKYHISLALKGSGLHPRWSIGAKLRKNKKARPTFHASVVQEEIVPINQSPSSVRGITMDEKVTKHKVFYESTNLPAASQTQRRVNPFDASGPEKIPAKEKNVMTPDQQLDNELSRWVWGQLRSGNRPTLSRISCKGIEIAKRLNVNNVKPLTSWAMRFLRRCNLREMWYKSLARERERAAKKKKLTMDFPARHSRRTPAAKEKLMEHQTEQDDEASSQSETSADNDESMYTDEFIESVGAFACKQRMAIGIVAKRFRISVDLAAKWKRLWAMNKVEAAVNEQLVAWVQHEHFEESPLQPKVLKEKAKNIAHMLGLYTFSPTKEWYRSFLRRNQFSQRSAPLLTDKSSPEMPPTDSYQKLFHEDTDSPGTPEKNPVIKLEDTISASTKHPHNQSSNHEHGKNRDERSFMNHDTADHDAAVTPVKPVAIKHVFGSFQSANLDEQIKYAESPFYGPPEIPVRPPTFDEYAMTDFQFGPVARSKHFFLEKGWLFMNHGAFGAVLKEAMDYYHNWQRYVESQPVRFFDRYLFPQIVHVQKRFANFLGCKVSDITFITNVTTAVNAILQGIPFKEDSSIYFLNITYDAVKKIIKHVCMRTGAKAVEVMVTLPFTNPDDIVSLVRSTLQNGTTLAVFDHIPSDHAFIMPIKELVSVCHQRGVPVLIDGAHGVGQVEINLSNLGTDYYVGNCHKWFCAPKGCGFLYTNKQLQRYTRGLTISHGYDEGFHSQFLWTGAKDYCSYLSLHALINFWTIVGPNNIRTYCAALMKDVVNYFQTKWDAELLAPIECHGMMCCISLPSVLFKEKQNLSCDDAEAIQNRLYSDFNIEVPIKCIENKLYVRVSVHIYNSFPEYASLASAIHVIKNSP